MPRGFPVWRLAALLAPVLALGLPACATPEPGPVPALLLGEQHDVAEHQQNHRQVIEALANRELLAAVVIEMAERGRGTQGLSRTADDAQVRAALGWNERAWPWAAYGPAIMAAVGAGAPVLGANLDAGAMKSAMADVQLDGLVPEAVLKQQHAAIRAGHCDMLPPAQIPAMTRVQLARDRAMAQAIMTAVQPGKTVVLLAGGGHVDPQLGVPLHLAGRVRAQAVMLPRVETGIDYCAEFRKPRGQPTS